MREKRTNHPLGRRTLAALLAICMLLTMTPAVAAEVETRTLTGFTALSDEVREQTVPHGTAREDLTLPDTLEATALVPAPAEIIEDAEPPLADVPAAETVLVTGVTWESAPAYDGAISGTYVFTPVLPAAYVPAAGVSLPVITVTVAQTEPSAADHVIAMIDALPAMEQWMAMEEAAARAAMDEILAAKAAYDGLTAEDKAQMDEASTGKLLELAEMAEQLAGATPMADTANPATVQANTADTTKLDVIAGGTTTTVDPLLEDVTITGSYTSIDIDISTYTGAVVPNVVLSGATILPLTPAAQTGTSGKPAVMPPKPAEKSEALSVDVKLVASIYTNAGDATPATTEMVQPKDGQPVLVKLLLPTGYALDTLEIWHVKESGSRSRIYDFWLVTEGGGTYAVFEVSSFSHFVFFAEKVKEPDVPTPPTPDNPGTGTGGGSASFEPEISKSEHGSITVSPERAKPGDKVTITAKPDEGYAVDTVIVKDSGGKTVAVTPGKDGTYTFTQPSGQVTVTVTFKPMEQKPTELPFTDVAQSDWFRDSVAYIYGQGLMNGTSSTTFSPYLSTDRGMIVTILWRMEGSPTATTAANFSDVAAGQYYTDAVAWGAEQGIILGYDDRRYAPGDPITREQLASILWRYARYKKWDVSVGENTNILSYLDFPQISEYAIPALQWAAGAQIMSGKSDGILDPKGNATRAETATMLERLLNKDGQ